MDCLPQIHMVAIHSEPGYRSLVPGVGLLCEKDSYILGGGQYSNSIGRMSAYVMVGKYLFEYDSTRIGAIAGGVTGYDTGTPMGSAPLAGMTLTKEVHWGPIHSINALLVPKVQGLTPAFVQFNLTLNLPK